MRYLAFIFICVTTFANAQDVIYMVNGDTIQSKIMKIDIDVISYHKANNLNSPVYVIPKKEVTKIVFENGTSEIYIKENKRLDISLEGTKATIVEYINKYAYEWKREHSYSGKFEGNLLRLSRVDNETNELLPNSRLFNFSGDCKFHTLSLRNDGFGYINVYAPLKDRSYTRKDYKLVIRVKGHDNAKILYDALIRYNRHFIKEY